MSTKGSSEAIATAGGDASIGRSGGDAAVQFVGAEIDSIRSEPGQGLGTHQDSFKKTDVVGMGFPDTKVAGSLKDLGKTDGLDARDLNLSGNSMDLLEGKAGSRPGEPKSGDAKEAETKGKDAKPKSRDRVDPHACYVDKGAKPFQTGIASIYSEVEGMSTGGVNDPTKWTAAHKSLPIGSKVCVTRPENTKGVEVTINDRGPYVKGRVIDMTPPAAADIGITKTKGLGDVELYTPGKYKKHP